MSRSRLFTMIDEHLAVPFNTDVLGVCVRVTKIDLTVEHEIVAIVRRDGHKQTIPTLDLPIPAPSPGGTEWIEASRRWRPEPVKLGETDGARI